MAFIFSCTRDCVDRGPECHIKCGKYIKEKQEHEERLSEIRKKRKEYNDILSARYDGVGRCLKKTNTKTPFHFHMK